MPDSPHNHLATPASQRPFTVRAAVVARRDRARPRSDVDVGRLATSTSRRRGRHAAHHVLRRLRRSHPRSLALVRTHHRSDGERGTAGLRRRHGDGPHRDRRGSAGGGERRATDPRALAAGLTSPPEGNQVRHDLRPPRLARQGDVHLRHRVGTHASSRRRRTLARLLGARRRPVARHRRDRRDGERRRSVVGQRRGARTGLLGQHSTRSTRHLPRRTGHHGMARLLGRLASRRDDLPRRRPRVSIG